MKYFFYIFILFSFNSFSQSVSGLVVNEDNDSPLQYVSIGIINTPISTISKKDGTYSIKYNEQYLDSIVRFSMMGYKDITIKVRELQSNTTNIIRLEPKIIQLPEVNIDNKSEEIKIGTISRSRMSGFCGWGGNWRGKGHEIGLKIDLGETYTEIKKIHIRIHKQSFSSSLFRLHIRDIENNLPTSDLLNENILIPLKQSSGWVDFDLTPYNIFLKGNVAVTLEWLEVSEVDTKKLVRVNKSKKKTANVLLSIKKNEGSSFFRWGSEAKWSINKEQSPSIYLTVSR